MKLSSLLNSRLIHFHDSLKSREQAVEILSQKISEHLNGKIPKETIIKGVNDREQLSGTIFSHGISIPHARIENFEDLIVAIMILKKPIIESGHEIRIIFLILTSKSSSNLYLHTLSSIAEMTLEPEFIEKITLCDSPESVISMIDGSGVRVKKEITVSNIMTTSFISVTPHTTIKELIDLFALKNITYAPVIGLDGTFKGDIYLSDIIASGLPDYVKMIGNMNFLSSIEPFEEMLRHEDNMTVSALMKMPSHKIHPETSIVELALRLIESCRKCATVENNGKVTGVVSLSDILNKLLRV